MYPPQINKCIFKISPWALRFFRIMGSKGGANIRMDVWTSVLPAVTTNCSGGARRTQANLIFNRHYTGHTIYILLINYRHLVDNKFCSIWFDWFVARQSNPTQSNEEVTDAGLYFRIWKKFEQFTSKLSKLRLPISVISEQLQLDTTILAWLFHIATRRFFLFCMVLVTSYN